MRPTHGMRRCGIARSPKRKYASDTWQDSNTCLLSLRQVKLMGGGGGGEWEKGKEDIIFFIFFLVFRRWVWRSGFRERNSNFSLKSTTFGPSILVGAKGKIAHSSRASCRYRNQGFLTNSTGKGLLLPLLNLV